MSAKKNTLESQELSESIINTVREPLIILDRDLKVITASRSFYDIFKVKREETEGQLIYNLGNRQWDIPKLRELLEDILPQKTIFNDFKVEHHFLTIGKRIMLLNARQIHRELGKEHIILLAIEDITERKLIEEKALLAAIVESSNDAIIAESLDGIITAWNKGAEEIYGYTKSEIIGKSISVIVPSELPDEMTEILRKIKRGEAILNYETVRQRKDGQEIYVLLMVSAIHDDKGRIVGASSIARDITERKQLEKLLMESEEQYRLLFENANDGILLMEKNEGKIANINPSVEKMLGYSAKEIIGKKLQDVGLIIDNGDFQITMKNLNEKGILRYNDVPVKIKSGLEIYTDTYLVDKAKFAQCNIRDITERKRAEEVLKESEKKYRLLADNVNDVIFVLDMNLNYTYISPSVKILRGYEPEEALKNTIAETLTPSSMDLALRTLSEIMEIEKSEHRDINISRTLELEMRRKDGTTVRTEMKASFIRDENQRPVGIMGVTRDISERKRAEDLLRQSEEKYRTILESIREGYFEVDLAGNFTFFNASMCRILGYSKEELAGMNYQQFTNTETSKKVFQAFNKVYNTGEPTEGFDWQIIRKDGTERYVETSVSLQKYSSDKPIGFRGIVRDVTERKKADEASRESEKRLSSIIHDLSVSSFVIGKDHKVLYWNKALESISNILAAEMVGTNQHWRAFYVQERPCMADLVVDEDIDNISQWYEGKSIKSNLIDGAYEVTDFFPALGEKGEWLRITASPVRDLHGNLVGAVETLENITKRKQAEEQLHQTIENLRKAVDTTIQVMISAVEMRDPYTAGHQLRVANLARTIATEMGLVPEKIEGIRMAGSIHDIGKLSIPAEILSKPTNLTDIEFSLIKEHSRIGYEALKDVKSPWPLAEIVYQHHERMNGSGYPRNLKGDEIIMEARIMAVADVVEAMASHRPYRPALGIEAALEEIEKYKGIFYDNTVADACLRLFREKGFQLT
jgi:PAS domain S-box-containing protein